MRNISTFLLLMAVMIFEGFTTDSNVPDGIEYKLIIRVTDSDNGNPLHSVKVAIFDNTYKEFCEVITDEKGEYVKVLKGYSYNQMVNLNITYSKEGYITKFTGYDKRLKDNGEYVVEIQMNPNSNAAKTKVLIADNLESSEYENDKILIVGSFKKDFYANRAIKRLKKDGYEVYTKFNGEFKRVGAYVSYTDESELAKEMTRLKENYLSNVWVLSDEFK